MLFGLGLKENYNQTLKGGKIKESFIRMEDMYIQIHRGKLEASTCVIVNIRSLLYDTLNPDPNNHFKNLLTSHPNILNVFNGFTTIIIVAYTDFANIVSYGF